MNGVYKLIDTCYFANRLCLIKHLQLMIRIIKPHFMTLLLLSECNNIRVNKVNQGANMDFTRCKIWKNDLKILGSALINSIKSLFITKIKCVSNNNKRFPLLIKHQKAPLSMPIPASKYVYYGDGAHDKNVILLSYTKLPVN